MEASIFAAPKLVAIDSVNRSIRLVLHTDLTLTDQPSVKCQSQPTSEIVSRSSTLASPWHGAAALPAGVSPFYFLALAFCLIILAISCPDLQVLYVMQQLQRAKSRLNSRRVRTSTPAGHPRHGPQSRLKGSMFRPSKCFRCTGRRETPPCGPVCHAVPCRHACNR